MLRRQTHTRGRATLLNFGITRLSTLFSIESEVPRQPERGYAFSLSFILTFSLVKVSSHFRYALKWEFNFGFNPFVNLGSSTWPLKLRSVNASWFMVWARSASLGLEKYLRAWCWWDIESHILVLWDIRPLVVLWDIWNTQDIVIRIYFTRPRVDIITLVKTSLWSVLKTTRIF